MKPMQISVQRIGGKVSVTIINTRGKGRSIVIPIKTARDISAALLELADEAEHFLACNPSHKHDAIHFNEREEFGNHENN